MTDSAPIMLLHEKELVTRITEGSEAAFTELYRFYSPRIYGFVVQKTKSEVIAEEVVQDVFLKIWSMKEKLSEIDNFRSYLFRMTTNRMYDHLNKVAQDTTRLNALWNDLQKMAAQNTVEELLDFKESNAILQEAIAALPEQRRKIYKLSKEEGLSYDEIAAMLSLSRNTVSDQLVKAGKFIREYVRNAAGPAAVLSIILLRILK